ncbi:WD-40 repeat-containing protein [Nitrosospira multiformis]|uniref:WD-40 repeat-containing protein n=1 Tax=Nitrosospira multiformis TaxID=1231 RepID=A0A1H8KGF5_9PROT|nr:TIR domain-containing protein [Nitrosospira multiformis]SEN91656.1 WD-40 repeat-containing protein [Nitrosospira multiformis]
MSLIFLSHSSVDELEAVALKHWLLDNGWDDVFLDLDPVRGLKAGERWQEALRRAADHCEAVIFIISPAWAKSKWCLTEFLLAKSLNKLIFGVVVKETPLGELPTELTSEYQLTYLIGKGSTEAIHFVHHERPADVSFLANGLGRLRLGLQTAGLSASFFPWPPKGDEARSPYRGFEPLDKEDAAVFFGRDVEILQGLDKLRGMRASGDEALFVILGPSGAGKSSFLRAGLLPRLKRDARHFHPLEVIRPERSPLFGERGLAHAISQANDDLGLKPTNRGEVKIALGESAHRLAQLLHNIQCAARHQLLGLPDNAPPPTLILPVDQAEELFNADATEEARRFLELLGNVLRASLSDRGGSPSLIVAFTIRSDRYEPLQTASELTGLKTVVFDALKPMPRAQFKEVITGPAERSTRSAKRLEVKADLVQQLLADCDQGADTLPLLSLTLSHLYRDYGKDGDLRLDEYQSMGGISNVIQTEIDSILAFDPETRKAQLEILHAAFIPWLAAINLENNQPMRRRARKSDLPSNSLVLIQALVEKRLLLSDMRDGEQVFEVAHESLLRQWDKLAEWLREEGDDLKDAVRLEQAASAWSTSGKKIDWLVEGERLAIFEAVAAKPGYRRRLELTSEFLLCSRQRETQRREAEERYRQAELLAAQERQAAAEESKKKAQIALAASNFREAQWYYQNNNIRYALAYLAHAVRLNPEGTASRTLLVNLLQQRSWFLPVGEPMRHEDTVWIAQFSPHGTKVVSVSLDDKAQLWNAKTGKPVGEPMRHEDTVWIAQFSLDGTKVVTASKDKTARLWDAKTAKPLGEAMRHEDTVWIAQFSLDGTKVVTASDDKTARLWDAKTGKPLGEPMRHEGEVRFVQFSPDGTRVVTASKDNTARLWDAKTGQPLGEAMRHEDGVNSAHFSPDGTRVVTASKDNIARLWDAKTGKPLGEPMRHEGEVRFVQFSPDGTRVVTASPHNTARLWDAKTGQPLGEAMRHEDGVNSAHFSPDGTKVVTASWDRTVRLWDAKTGQPLGEAMRHEDGVNSAHFSPDGTRVVTASKDNTARLWDAKTGQPLGEAMEHEDKVTSAQFSPDGTKVVTVSEDHTVRLWDAKTGKLVGETMEHEGDVISEFSPDGTKVVIASMDKTAHLSDIKTGKPVGETMEHEDKVTSAQFSPDGTKVMTVSEDHTARLWDAKTGQPLGEAMRHEDGVNSAHFSPDGTRVVTASWDNTARLWDAQTGRPLGEVMRHESWVISARFSPDGKKVVTASVELTSSGDNTARLWDAQTGRPLGEVMRHAFPVQSAQFSPHGTKVVSASLDGKAQLWNAKTGKPVGKAMRHNNAISSAQFSPDGTKVVTGSWDRTARLWDAKTGKPVGEAMRHEGWVNSAQFSPDGTKVVTVSEDHTARLWDGKTGKPVSEAMRHEGWVNSAQFSPDGNKVLTASKDKTTRVWDISVVVSNNKDLLSALAEAIGGKQLNELGAIEPLEDQIGQINKLREQTANAPLGEPTAESFIRWFFSDPWTRVISPFSRLTVPEYIQQQIDANRRDQVEQEFPGHPLLRQRHAKD